MKSTDYKIISDNSANDLEKQVKELINYGWQPIGGVDTFVFTDKSGVQHSIINQAMIKVENNQ